MKKELVFGLLTLIAFGVYYTLNELYFASIYYAILDVLGQYPLSFFLTYAGIGIPTFVLAAYFFKGNVFKAFGLNGNFLVGLVSSFLFTLPMLVGYGVLNSFEVVLEWKNFWFGCVFAGFFEELYYRGFFFGMLHKRTRLGFFPALIVSALVFASLHLYQSDDLGTMFGVFMTTFMGAGLFAWLYVEWNYNLWIPIFLHFFMNLSWELFAVADNAMGDFEANIFRAMTIGAAIVGTIVYKRRKGLELSVNKRTLWLKSRPLDFHQ